MTKQSCWEYIANSPLATSAFILKALMRAGFREPQEIGVSEDEAEFLWVNNLNRLLVVYDSSGNTSWSIMPRNNAGLGSYGTLDGSHQENVNLFIRYLKEVL